MSIGINYKFTFGKHKGKTFAEVMLLPDGPGYCAWLRSEKKRDTGITGFSKEANDVIDEAIRTSKSLRSKYQIENATANDLEAVLKARLALEERKAMEVKVVEEERQAAYAETWGEW